MNQLKTVWDRINNWKNIYIYQAGKEVIIKAIAQTIPTYSMSLFQLPNKLCKDIGSCLSNFWWGFRKNDKRIQWRKWTKLGLTKTKGGLEFRDIWNFNKELLAKQVWWVLLNPNSWFPKHSKLNTSLKAISWKRN